MGRYIGEVKDTIIDLDGNIIEERDWSPNTICDGLGIMVACLLKQHAGYDQSLYWAVGSGNNWDAENPPAPSKSDTKLANEIGRKAISPSNIQFVDGSGIATLEPTNRLLITQTFEYGECNGNWMEMAIVGGNATITKDTGLLVNHKTHKLVEKNVNRKIERQVRFTFRQEV